MYDDRDIVFKNNYVDGTRGELETLYPGIDIACGAIDMFTHVLNDAEKQRNKKTPTRLFCHTSMLVSFIHSNACVSIYNLGYTVPVSCTHFNDDFKMNTDR